MELILPIVMVFVNEGKHSIAVYSSNESVISLVGLKNVFISLNEYENCKNQNNQQIGVKWSRPEDHSIGLQYSVWHGFAANAVFKMQKLGANVTTIETMIREGNSIDDYWSHGVNESDSRNGYFQVQPERGFYCIYRKRENESGIVDDCPDIEKTLSDHAQILTESGIDYVYVDLTNLCERSSLEDVVQRRPMQVLFEEWHKLRLQGKQTPQIVAWNRNDGSGCTTWRDYLDLYDKYPDLVWKDSNTGKNIFMGTKKSDPKVKQQIESNDGKNDTIAINNWVANMTEAPTGLWQFMGHCGDEFGIPSTDIISRDTCDQAVTRNSAIGDQISTGISYQMNYASIQWGCATSFYGLTFLMQWETALRMNPKHITISGWNEFFAGAWENPWKGYTKSLGLNGSDNRLFVDLYGAHRARDIEPTVEYGNTHLDLMQSCIRVRNLNLYNNRNDCSVQNEICCQLNRFKRFIQIHSFIRDDKNDYILIADHKQRETILQTNYTEICTFNSVTREYCSNGNPKDPIEGLSGPFILYNVDGADQYSRPIYRCKDIDHHFISLQEDCEGTQLEFKLGYLSTKKDSLFARSLIRCITPEKVRYHSLDGNCHPNDTIDGPIYGYVI